MKVLAIDFGSKRIGLAVGDTFTRIAAPLEQIRAGNPRQVLKHVLELIVAYEVGQIVVGYPLNADGEPSRTCGQVDRFVAFLRKRIALPVTLVNERLSSFAADELSREITPSFRRRRDFSDSVAAQVILQNFFGQP